MIYIDTRRHFWRPANTFTRMGGTVLVAALAFFAPAAATAVLLAKLIAERVLLRASPVSSRLHDGPLRTANRTRLGLGLVAAVLFLFGQSALGFVVFAVGELLERTLYFRAVDSPKMPGQPAAT